MSKRLLLKIHRWCGLIACLFVLSQALTGSLLLFRGALAEMIDPAGMTRHTASGEAPLSAVLASAQARYPGFEVQRLVFPQDARATYLAHLVDQQGVARYASLDPGDAQVLRAGSLWRFPMEALLAVHLRLVTGKAGLAVVALVGVTILSMAATGLSYWWPKAGRWKTSLKINWRMPGKAVLRQAHRSAGVVVAGLAILSAGTGLTVALEYLVEPGPIVDVSPSGGPWALAGVDTALAKARALYPGRGLRDVRLPARGKFNVFFWAPERSAMAVHAVKISLPAAQVVATTPASANHALWVTFLPIHSGDAFGLPGRLLLLLGALGLATLAVTGPIMWLQKRS